MTIEETYDMAQEMGIPLLEHPAMGQVDGVAWTDAEEYEDRNHIISWPDEDWLTQAEAEYARLSLHPAVYTGEGFWRKHMGNTGRFSHWVNWNAAYGGQTPIPLLPRAYGDWTEETTWGRQWTSTPIDQNVFREGSLPMPELTPAIKDEYADLFNAWWEAGGWMNFGTYIAATGAADVPDYQFREFLRNRLDSVVNEVKVHLDR